MPNSQTMNEYSVSAAGVSATKSIERDDYPVPAIAIEFASERDDAVEVRYVDPAPAGVDRDDIGFHQAHGEEYWEIQGEDLVFESELEPGETYTTIYAIRSPETALEDVFAEPRSLDVAPVGGDGSNLDAAIPEVSQPGSASEAVSDGSGHGAATVEESPASAEPAQESLVSELTAQIESGAVSDDELEALRSALGTDAGSLEARVSRLQADLADLRAYTSALESFLDEHGTGEQLIADFEARLEDVEAELAEVESRVGANETAIDEQDTALADIEDQLPEADVAAELEALRADVSAVEDWRDRIQTFFQGDPTAED